MRKRLSLLLLCNLTILLLASPAFASFHLMKIEAAMGGVGGDTTQQAVQLRMRAAGQNLVGSGQTRLIAWDAAGLNPVTLIVFPSNVTNAAQGARILVVSPNFASLHPDIPGDFTMTSVIPSSYLPAGRLTFEDGFGTIFWSLAWGGAGYTGSTAGSFPNDGDGEFGPPFASALPSTANRALLFTAPDPTGDAPSTTNLADFGLTPGSAVFTNNAGTSGALVASLALFPIATGLDSPVAITNAHDGSGRLFITLQDGRVMLHDGCVVHLTPFLDISSLVLSGGERGLLSIAFHPSFPATPYFYVYYTRLGDGALVIARYRVSVGNPNLADPASGVILLVIPHPVNGNHNGGQLQFGPDGYLYIGTGDGGSGDDPPCNAQNNDTLLGRILRIDVNQNFDTPPYYGIPPTNPGTVGLPETWAKGMRNPWRFSFDRLTGDLLIGDVGQNQFEEVDLEPAGAAGGRNYGWKVMEGNNCTGTSTSTCTVTPPACFSPSYTAPVFDYSHASGRCAITGGYRYRGSQIPALAGNYVYGDLCNGQIFQAAESGGVWSSGVSTPFSSGLSISTFGEDEAGELYVANYSVSGAVYRIVSPGPQADLSVTKTDGQASAVPGQPVTYTITVGNAGPFTAYSATVADTFPVTLQNVNWTCSASPGSSCCSIVGGGGSINNRPVTVLPGGTVTYTATATIDPVATGTVSNTATVSAPASVTDPNPANNAATDTDTLPQQQADLSIMKTDGQATVVPGSPITYTIVASNAGPAVANGATVADMVPAAITGVNWTCLGSGGGTCAASGPGNINDTVNLPVGGTVTYTLTGTISASATGSLSNTATVAAPGGAADPNLGNNSATDTDTLTPPQADLSITKTDGQASAVPGSLVTYTIIAGNTGPSPATGATVADMVPAAITGATWTCSGAGGGTCAASGSGDINDTVDLPEGTIVTYTLTGTVSASATGSLSNTATVTAPAGVTDPSPADNSATDTDTLTPQANLSITKTDGQATAVSGSPITYTIVASNAGPSVATGATVADTVPAAITGVTWTCAGAGGGTCAASGSGSINDTVNLPVGGSVTYTLTGMINPSATGTLSNTATITAPGGVTDPNPTDNSATDTDALVGLDYYTLTPCRVVDTRGGAPLGGPVLQGQETRVFTVASLCGISSTAKAVSINLTVTQSTSAGNVRLFPAGQTLPNISSINYTAGQTRANNAVVSLDPSGALAAFVGQPAGTTVHLIIDVNGYFQ
jgi:uncharacterized repeat protein (TIGR01451 family)